MSVMDPVLPSVKVPLFTVMALLDSEPLRTNPPELTTVEPVYVLAPPRVAVPDPVTEIPPVPLIELLRPAIPVPLKMIAALLVTLPEPRALDEVIASVPAPMVVPPL